MRLIDADELFKKALDIIKDKFDNKELGILNMIAIAETVDAEPVKHGKWNLTEKTSEVFPYLCDISCSTCGYGSFATDEQSVADWLEDTKYCSNCGVKMDGGIEDD